MAYTQAQVNGMSDAQVGLRLLYACAGVEGTTMPGDSQTWASLDFGNFDWPLWFKRLKEYLDATGGPKFPIRRYCLVSRASLEDTAACLGYDGVPESYLDTSGIYDAYRAMLLWWSAQ